jgi:hypothetical protein
VLRLAATGGVERFLFASIGAATVAVSAQPRMEGTTSPFTYEAVGATPSLTLGGIRRGNHVDRIAAKQELKTPAANVNRAMRIGAFPHETVGATRDEKIEEPAAIEKHPPHQTTR